MQTPLNAVRLRIASFAAVAIAIVGVAVLAGWTFNVSILRTLLPGFVPMNPLVALCLLASAVCLPRLVRHGADRIALTLATVIAVVAAMRISDYVLHPFFRIDQRLFVSKLALDVPSAPNEMAPNAAFCLLLTGIAFLSFSTVRWRNLILKGCTVVTVAICWFALVGYLLSSSPMYRVGKFTPMALHTAICLLLIALTTLAVGPREVLLRVLLGNTSGSTLVRVAVPTAFLVPTLVAYLGQTGRRLNLYGPGLGSALSATLMTILILAILIPAAGFLHRLDTERRQYQRRLESNLALLVDLAAIDGLTGVLNRRSFEEVLATHQERVKATQSQLSLIMLDLDNFKQYNDRNGHREGDELLKQVGEILRGSIRTDDAAARYGGDEFAVILPRASADAARLVADRIRSSFNDSAMAAGGVTASLGVVTVDHSFEGDLVSLADECLYLAKREGKNTVVAYAL